MGKIFSLCSRKNHFVHCSKISQIPAIVLMRYMVHCLAMTDFYVYSITANSGFVSISLGPKQIPIQFKPDTDSQINVFPERVFGQLQYSAPLERHERHFFHTLATS